MAFGLSDDALEKILASAHLNDEDDEGDDMAYGFQELPPNLPKPADADDDEADDDDGVSYSLPAVAAAAAAGPSFVVNTAPPPPPPSAAVEISYTTAAPPPPPAANRNSATTPTPMLTSATTTAAWTSCCLAVSGSVAAVKAPDIVAALLSHGVSVDVVVTESAVKLMKATYRGAVPWERLHAFVYEAKLLEQQHASSSSSSSTTATATATATAPPTLRVHRDADEWSAYGDVGADPVLHVELAKRNKLLLLAPLCANTLGMAALGLCGNLVGSVLRAWYYDMEPSFAQPLVEKYGHAALNRPVLAAPAMNTYMWHQKVTGQHLETLKGRGVEVVAPIEKRLACGDVGMGAMAEVEAIVDEAVRLLRSHKAEEQKAREEGRPAFVAG